MFCNKCQYISISCNMLTASFRYTRSGIPDLQLILFFTFWGTSTLISIVMCLHPTDSVYMFLFPYIFTNIFYVFDITHSDYDEVDSQCNFYLHISDIVLTRCELLHPLIRIYFPNDSTNQEQHLTYSYPNCFSSVLGIDFNVLHVLGKLSTYEHWIILQPLISVFY